jgi:Right handed beta helix region
MAPGPGWRSPVRITLITVATLSIITGVLLRGGLPEGPQRSSGGGVVRDSGIGGVRTTTGDAPDRGLNASRRYPTVPPVQVCANSGYLDGPATPPSGAVTIPAGDDSDTVITRDYLIHPHTIYWFAPGVHTLGSSEWSQIPAADGDRFTGAPGAIIDGQGKNHYAFTAKGTTGVTIDHLTIQNFGLGSSPTTPSRDNNNAGVVNQGAGHKWTIENNTIRFNAGAGVFIGSGDIVRNNCLTKNAQYGFAAYEDHDVNNVDVSYNEISYNDTYDWESHVQDCGCTGGGKFWRTRNARFSNNYVHDNHSVGLWADTDNSAFHINGNYISNNQDEGIIYELSYNALIDDNTFVGNDIVGGVKDRGFPHGAVYISESGSDPRVPGAYGASFQIIDNMFRDNWGGVALWENANRYCSSTANSSSSDCTMVNSAANLKSCGNPALLTTGRTSMIVAGRRRMYR